MDIYTRLFYSLYNHTLVTFIESFLGLLIGSLVAVIVFFLILKFPKSGKIVSNIMLIFQIVPFIALAPLAVLIFGFEIHVKIGIVAWMAFFPCLLAYLRGFEEIPNHYKRLLKTLNASKFQIFIHLQLPFLRPYFFTGLKSSAVWAVSAAISAEGLGAEYGIGLYLRRTLSLFRMDLVLYGAVAAALCGLVLYGIVLFLDYITNPNFLGEIYEKK